MKTIKDHLMALPSPYAEMAIAECSMNLLRLVCPDTSSAILVGFLWVKSEIGPDFWSAVYEDAKFNKTAAE